VKSNFSFLADKYPDLEKLGVLAESYLHSDPNSCLFKLGAFAETIVNYMYDLDGLPPIPYEENTLANKIRKLRQEGMLNPKIDNILYTIRTKRNIAVHAGHDSVKDCNTLLSMAHTLSVWFTQTYNDASLGISERKERGGHAADNLKLSESETRMIIDEQLRKVGWEADTENLRYSKGTLPQKGRKIAIAEWPTDSSVCEWGSADYVLFCDLQLVGVIEAKAAHKDVSSVIDNQCRDYSKGIKEEHAQYVISKWGTYKAPFLFATNGKPYLKQLETKSGVWFRDARQESNIPKALHGWISP